MALEKLIESLDVYPKPITWQQLKDFVNSIPEDKLSDNAYLLYQDESKGKPLLEPFFIDHDVYMHVDDDEDTGSIDELQYAHGSDFDLADYKVVTPKGTPFLWAE